MRNILIIITLVFSASFLSAQNVTKRSEAPIHKKEISVSRLPKAVTRYIAANLPNARITKVIKQRRTPDAKYVVSLDIKTKHHILVFNRRGELVKLDGKILRATVPVK